MNKDLKLLYQFQTGKDREPLKHSIGNSEERVVEYIDWLEDQLKRKLNDEKIDIS